MICEKCGFENGENSNFCSKCGAVLTRGKQLDAKGDVVIKKSSKNIVSILWVVYILFNLIVQLTDQGVPSSLNIFNVEYLANIIVVGTIVGALFFGISKLFYRSDNDNKRTLILATGLLLFYVCASFIGGRMAQELKNDSNEQKNGETGVLIEQPVSDQKYDDYIQESEIAFKVEFPNNKDVNKKTVLGTTHYQLIEMINQEKKMFVQYNIHFGGARLSKDNYNDESLSELARTYLQSTYGNEKMSKEKAVVDFNGRRAVKYSFTDTYNDLYLIHRGYLLVYKKNIVDINVVFNRDIDDSSLNYQDFFNSFEIK